MEINMLGTGFIDREEFIRLDYTSDSTWIIHKKKYIIVLKQYRPEKILIGRNQRVSWGEIAAFGREIRLANIHASGEIRAPSARKKPQSNAFLKSYPLGITPI
jgi:hypothetical protein